MERLPVAGEDLQRTRQLPCYRELSDRHCIGPLQVLLALLCPVLVDKCGETLAKRNVCANLRHAALSVGKIFVFQVAPNLQVDRLSSSRCDRHRVHHFRNFCDGSPRVRTEL